VTAEVARGEPAERDGGGPEVGEVEDVVGGRAPGPFQEHVAGLAHGGEAGHDGPEADRPTDHPQAAARVVRVAKPA
jgi:hypothetical protein